MLRTTISAACLALAAAQDPDVTAPPGNWTQEAGGSYREGATAYNGIADSWGQARFFYYSLSDGSTYCDKPQPDTASATPVLYNDVWVVCDCTNNIMGFQNPDKISAAGGQLAPIWRWQPPNVDFTTSPAMATPVIDRRNGLMYVLYKDPIDAKLFKLQLNGGYVAPTLVWTLDLGAITGTNDNGQQVAFTTWSPDHSIFLYGGKVWIPSNDFDGALIVDTQALPPYNYIWTEGLYDISHRLQGSCGGSANNWNSPVFVASGSRYGFKAFDQNSGNMTWSTDISFYMPVMEFSHPVAVSFQSNAYGTFNCIVGSRWDSIRGIVLSGADANSSAPCGFWNYDGYSIRHPALAMPTWMSAPAVLYDGYQTAFLIYAVVLPSGDRSGGRTHWRSSLVTIQVDQSGPYNAPVDVYVMSGVHFNAAPLIVRDAWGTGNHAVTVGASDGNLYVFPAWGYTSTGPVLSHSLIPLLPPPGNPTFPSATNRNVGISGNYMAASPGGSIAFIAHNPDAQMNWFGVVTGSYPCTLRHGHHALPHSRTPLLASWRAGVMYSLPTDPSPTPAARPAYATPSPRASASPGPAAAVVAADATGAVLGSLGGIAAVMGAIVIFLPTAGFTMGGTRVIPADVIKGAASSTWGGIKSLGHAVTGTHPANTPGVPKAFVTSGSGGATSPYAGSERASLLSSARVPQA